MPTSGRDCLARGASEPLSRPGSLHRRSDRDLGPENFDIRLAQYSRLLYIHFMSGWVMAVTIIGGWCALSLVVGVVLGHVIAGRPLRERPAALGAVAPDFSMDEPAAPAAIAV